MQIKQHKYQISSHISSHYYLEEHKPISSATMSDRKAVIKNADMGEEMQQDAVDCATQALEKYNIEKVRISFHS
jgi:Dynein light chain type 1